MVHTTNILGPALSTASLHVGLHAKEYIAPTGAILKVTETTVPLITIPEVARSS